MNSIYSVGQVNNYIKNMFQQDFLLNKISIKGEVSNCKYHTSGHIYFSLKDETGALACVMFAGQRKGLAFPMKNGDKVVVNGSVSVYERDGKYQLYAKEITLEGAGILYERFLALKAELEEMGMFAGEYKQPIPVYARTVGIVTAPTGAAIQDIRNVAGRRNPYTQLILYPALVQGEGAKESIIEGGGSMEDLWAFNEEAVARAIFNCKTPIISAVGHETDTTIADFVADLRAPTPSAAAELAVADIRSVFQSLENYRQKLSRNMENKIQFLQQQIKHYEKRLMYGNPEFQIREKRTRLLDLENRIQSAMEAQIFYARQNLSIYIERMKGLSPLEKLNQGFSYVENQKGSAITSISQVKAGEELSIQVTDGTIRTKVTDVKKEKRGA